MANSREELINRLSEGKGYAFLTRDQKSQVNRYDAPPVTTIEPTSDQLNARLAGAGLNAQQISDVQAGKVSGGSSTGGVPSPYSTPGTGTPTNRRYTASTGSMSDNAAAAGYDTTPPTADEEAAIREKTYKEIQGEVDAINAAYASIVSGVRREGEGLVGGARALSARSGTLGSDFGNAEMSRARGVVEENVAAKESEKAAKISAIFSKANTRANDLVEQQKKDAASNTEAYRTYLKGAKEDARNDVKALATSGVSLEDLTDDEYKKLIDQSGYTEPIFKAVYNANLPANQKREYHYEKVGNNLIAVSMNPVTKKLERESFAGAVPEGYDEFTVTTDGTPLFINKSTGEAKVAEGFTEGQFSKEQELDTYTDASGNRISVMYNPGTKKTRTINLGKAEGATDTMVTDLQGAQSAIEGGADVLKVRQRFLEKYPTKGQIYKDYFKIEF